MSKEGNLYEKLMEGAAQSPEKMVSQVSTDNEQAPDHAQEQLSEIRLKMAKIFNGQKIDTPEPEGAKSEIAPPASKKSQRKRINFSSIWNRAFEDKHRQAA
ncbi:hypothetical protein FWH30_00630 [Microgenomates group bacterium]|nr:hypothetical protein [Microgenomates group bacterium]